MFQNCYLSDILQLLNRSLLIEACVDLQQHTHMYNKPTEVWQTHATHLLTDSQLQTPTFQHANTSWNKFSKLPKTALRALIFAQYVSYKSASGGRSRAQRKKQCSLRSLIEPNITTLLPSLTEPLQNAGIMPATGCGHNTSKNLLKKIPTNFHFQTRNKWW